MADFFTGDHFKLLNKWQGQARDKTNPEQNRAYEDLQKAYVLTEQWANLLQTQLFPEGFVSIQKRPTNRGNNFQLYTWAKIYPRKDAPKELAYTVGIKANEGFEVKIDTRVGLDGSNPVRRSYEKLRDSLAGSSPIVAVLPMTDGLTKDMAALVQWSAEAIGKFGMTYDEAAKKLGLQNGTVADGMNDDTIGSGDDEAPARNTIFYGPPGTGKTYAVQRMIEEKYTQKPLTLTTEEWKQQFIAEKVVQMTWWEVIAAALYDLGEKGKVRELLNHPFIQARATGIGRRSNVAQTLWGILQGHTIEESKTVKSKRGQAPAIFDKTADSTWKLIDGWKDECSDVLEFLDRLKAGPKGETPAIKRYCFVTFHQSYGYEEFVEGLRPVLNAESEGLFYEIRNGAFRDLCERARKDSNHRYAMVIDEINRGNISKIFGELITLIEPDKRAPTDGSQPRLEVKLAYSGDLFSVPANIDIIGTMNTADRSLALVDTALRRRFEFVPFWPETGKGTPLSGLVVSKDGLDIDVRGMLDRMNRRIEALYDRDHTIGHAYFTPLRDISPEARFEVFRNIFQQKILPLLEEFFFEDWQKIRLVLGDNQKPEDAQFIIVGKDSEEGLIALFGNDHGLDVFATKPRFHVNASAFENPKAYQGVYA
jgi:5-methylcytosine-specific restriction protein B